MASRISRYSEKGAAAVEFAILLPLLLLVIFGGIEYGLLMYNKQILTNASREAARAGIVSRAPRLSDAQIQAVARNYADAHMVTFDSTTTGIETPVVAYPGGQAFGDDLTVTVSYRYSFLLIPDLSGLFGESLPGSLNLVAATTMRYE